MIDNIEGVKIENLLTMKSEGKIDASGAFTIELGAREGKLFLFKN